MRNGAAGAVFGPLRGWHEMPPRWTAGWARPSTVSAAATISSVAVRSPVAAGSFATSPVVYEALATARAHFANRSAEAPFVQALSLEAVDTRDHFDDPDHYKEWVERHASLRKVDRLRNVADQARAAKLADTRRWMSVAARLTSVRAPVTSAGAPTSAGTAGAGTASVRRAGRRGWSASR